MLKLVLLVLTYWSSSAQLCKDILILVLEITAAAGSAPPPEAFKCKYFFVHWTLL